MISVSHQGFEIAAILETTVQAHYCTGFLMKMEHGSRRRSGGAERQLLLSEPAAFRCSLPGCRIAFLCCHLAFFLESPALAELPVPCGVFRLLSPTPTQSEAACIELEHYRFECS